MQENNTKHISIFRENISCRELLHIISLFIFCSSLLRGSYKSKGGFANPMCRDIQGNFYHFSSHVIFNLFFQYRVLAGSTAWYQGSIQGTKDRRESLSYRSCVPNLLVVSFLCRRVDALPKGGRVH